MTCDSRAKGVPRWYAWVAQTLAGSSYSGQDRAADLRQYLAKMTLSPQVTRLIANIGRGVSWYLPAIGGIDSPASTRRPISSGTAVPETLSGPATRNLQHRAVPERLAGSRWPTSIDCGVLYRQRRLHFTKTRPSAVSIGERRQHRLPASGIYIKEIATAEGPHPRWMK